MAVHYDQDERRLELGIDHAERAGLLLEDSLRDPQIASGEETAMLLRALVHTQIALFSIAAGAADLPSLRDALLDALAAGVT